MAEPLASIDGVDAAELTQPLGPYVLLVRHGERARRWCEAERDQLLLGMRDAQGTHVEPLHSNFRASGVELAYAMAGRLADELDHLPGATPGRPVVAEIRCARSNVARHTAHVLAIVLRRRGHSGCDPTEDEKLDPNATRDPRAIARELEGPVAQEPGGRDDSRRARVRVVVGHQPMLGRIASALGHVPADQLPIGRCEMALMRQEVGGWRLAWLLTNKSADVVTAVRAKIASKLDMAKFFLGALVVNSGILLNGEVWKVTSRPAMFSVATGMSLLVLALGLTIATLLAYDQLQMPPDFWASTQTPRRSPRWRVEYPPSESVVVQFYEMVHVWEAMFQPAIGAALAGITAVGVGLAIDLLRRPDATGTAVRFVPLPLALGWTVLLAFVVAAYFRDHRPDLGSSD